MRSMKRGYFTLPVLIILAVIIFAVAILIALNTDLVKRVKNQSNPTPVSSPTLSQSPTTQQPSSTSDETADWKTYANDGHKFTFKYPNTLDPKDYTVVFSNKPEKAGVVLNIGESELIFLWADPGISLVGATQEDENITTGEKEVLFHIYTYQGKKIAVSEYGNDQLGLSRNEPFEGSDYLSMFSVIEFQSDLNNFGKDWGEAKKIVSTFRFE